MPAVARGDLDITQIVAGPPLFNQHSEGFDIKIICSTIEAHQGWADNLCVIVRKDLWDSGAIRKITDLRGHHIDGATTGSPTNYLVNRTLIKAGLTYDDVTYTSRLKTPPDTFAALQNKAVDVVASVEPEATAIVDKGVGVRLVTTQDVIPDLQNGFLVASADYIKTNRATVVRFLKSCLLTEQEIVKNGTSFTPDVVTILQRWTELPLDLVQKLAPPYFGQYGMINVKALKDQQAYWQSKNLLPEKVDVESMIDSSMLTEARAELGIH
jgi:ABC-type nitrate/sulfonate/bicarbonate transport system substrate-binding protein